MDTSIQKLKRLAMQGDAEDKARYLAVLVKSGKLHRRAVQLAAMFYETPEASLLEEGLLGKDADLRQKYFTVLQDAPHADLDNRDLCKQLLLNGWELPLSVRRLLEAEDRKIMAWMDVDNQMDDLLTSQFTLILGWMNGIVTDGQLTDTAGAIMSMSYSFHITPELVANWLLYGDVMGLR